jgi:uncharacterized protein YndB with AHSA1/START domain
MARSLVFHGSIRINAPLARVWAVLTTPALTKRFMFGGEAISAWKVGSPLVWRVQGSKKVLKGTIIAIDPGTRLSYTIIDPEAPYPIVPENSTTVTYQLTGENGQTVVSVSDGDFATVADGEKRYERTVWGWGIALQKLKEVAEEPDGT